MIIAYIFKQIMISWYIIAAIWYYLNSVLTLSIILNAWQRTKMITMAKSIIDCLVSSCFCWAAFKNGWTIRRRLMNDFGAFSKGRVKMKNCLYISYWKYDFQYYRRHFILHSLYIVNIPEKCWHGVDCSYVFSALVQ